MKATKGFTLVELIVVITILAILATIGFLSLQGYTSDAKNTKTVANLRTVASTLVNESGITGQGFDAYGKALSDPSNSMSGVAGTGDTVYSGAVDWTSSAYYAADVDAGKLKIDGSKFFDNGKPFVMASVTVSEQVNGKTRLRSTFQVAGTLNNAGSETALVEGTYATGAGPTDIDGLINAYDWTTGVAKPVTAGGVNLPYSLK